MPTKITPIKIDDTQQFIPNNKTYNQANNIETIDNSYDPKKGGNIPMIDPPKLDNNINKYTPDGLPYFGMPGVEMIDPTVGLSTLGMGALSALSGLGNYISNNLIMAGSMYGLSDETIMGITVIENNWSSLFEENGLFSGLNENSTIKYNDEAWQTGNMIGHAVSIGGGRQLSKLIPEAGPFVAALVTYGDGYGKAYREARKNGIDKFNADLMGIGNGAIQAFSFSQEGFGVNLAIGTAMPFLDTFIKTITGEGEGSFIERYSENFNEMGGIKAVLISTAMYGLNGIAHVNNTASETTNLLALDSAEAVSRISTLQSSAIKVFDTAFITTALNTILNTFIPDIKLPDHIEIHPEKLT